MNAKSQFDAVVSEGIKYLEELKTAAEAGQLVWQSADQPPRIVGFNGISEKFNVMVAKFDTGDGFTYNGMCVVSGGSVNVVVLPPPLALELFRMARAKSN